MLLPKNKQAIKHNPINGFQLYVKPKEFESINPYQFTNYIEYKEFGGSKYTSTLTYQY